MSDVIPPEIISEIFIRLPVVSLLRLRSVCKQFRALIDSQHFVKSHLNRSLKMNTNQSLICKIEGYLHTMDFDLFEKDFRTSFYGSKVVSSSNGLVCLTCRDILIANPSLRKHTTLPRTTIKYPSRAAEIYKVVYGFGYDPVNDDYKVVRIEIFYIPGFVLDQNEVKVYSMKSNSWRKIKDFPHIPIGVYDNGVFVNGALHWLVTVNHKLDDGYLSSLPDKIVSFDIVTEEYGQIPLPQYTPCTVPNGMKIELWELGGSLCVQCNYEKKNIDLWVMNAYGIAGSWTKLCSIEQPIDSDYMSEYLTALTY